MRTQLSMTSPSRARFCEELDLCDVEIVGGGHHPGAGADSRFTGSRVPRSANAGNGGFEVIRNLQGGAMPVVIIVTAFDQHAIEAFEAGAVDYLLKPVNETRLLKAVHAGAQSPRPSVRSPSVAETAGESIRHAAAQRAQPENRRSAAKAMIYSAGCQRSTRVPGRG